MGTRHQLRRDIGLPGAVMLGLGSIVGTGIFVSLGVAAGVAGANILPAIVLAALVATCNGLSSAQLAALHPVSGGTYEYGYRWLTPAAGFTAGWLFLCAKSASAATAALGLAGYLQLMFGAPQGKLWLVLIALAALAVLAGVVLLGIRRTTLVNSVIVGVTLTALLLFVVVLWRPAVSGVHVHLQGLFSLGAGGWKQMLAAAALMFVSYTGYGRIATLGEEVTNPARTIPQAMIVTLSLTLVLYLAVSFVAVAAVGPVELGEATQRSAAPLLVVAEQLDHNLLAVILAAGAVTAMLGVLLNLLLGLSRVVLAMARRSDMPRQFSTISARGVPVPATLFVVLVVAVLIGLGDVRLSWSFTRRDGAGLLRIDQPVRVANSYGPANFSRLAGLVRSGQLSGPCAICRSADRGGCRPGRRLRICLANGCSNAGFPVIRTRRGR